KGCSKLVPSMEASCKTQTKHSTSAPEKGQVYQADDGRETDASIVKRPGSRSSLTASNSAQRRTGDHGPARSSRGLAASVARDPPRAPSRGDLDRPRSSKGRGSG